MQKKTNKHSAKRLDDLVFMVPRYEDERHFATSESGLSFYNIFQLVKVRDSIALYKYTNRYEEFIKLLKKEGDLNDWVHWIFSSTQGRIQHEIYIGSPFGESGEKNDVYNLFIKPNAALLKEMVDSVSKASCKEAWENYKARISERRRLFKDYQKAKKEHGAKI